MSKGLIKEAAHTFASNEQVPSRFLNLLQADDVRLSDGQQGLFISRNLPKIHTSDYKMAVTAGPNTVTLSAGVGFDVGGVIYSTDDLTSRAFTIPDGTTKYLYAAVADDCGEPVDWSTDPIQRKLTVAMTLEDSKTESTPSKMLILKAVKATAGETPTVTLYANEGLPNGLTGAILPWSDSIAYTQGRSVIGSDHRIYRSRITDNLNNNPTAAGWEDNWELLTRDHVTEAQATISGGVAHVSGFFNRLLPEGDAADTLDYLSIGNLADGQYVIIRNADAAHTITVTHGAGGPGQILDPDEADLDLDDVAKLLVCRREGTDILVVSKLGSAWGDQTGIGGSSEWYYGDGSDGDLVVTANQTIPVAALDEDNIFLISNFNNLTINSGASLTPERRVRCWVVYVQGDCTINGALHMNSKGAAGSAQDLQIEFGLLAYAAPYLTPDDVDVFNVPATGAGYGATPLAGQTGYGGGGRIPSDWSARVSGTAYRGGSGGGGAWYNRPATANADPTGPGGNGYTDNVSCLACAGGAGVPPGSNANYCPDGSASSSAGGAGGGGTIFLIVQGALDVGGTGAVTSNGGAGGNAWSSNVAMGGGGAGGGSVNIFYKGSLVNSGTVEAAGGAGGSGTAQSIDGSNPDPRSGAGQSGGDGSVRIVQVDQ